MRIRFALTFLILGHLGAGHAEKPDGLKWTVQQHGPVVLPFQALRIRGVLLNGSDEAKTGLKCLEHRSSVRRVIGPDPMPDVVADPKVGINNWAMPVAPTSLGAFLDHNTPTISVLGKFHSLILQPGQKETITYAISLDYGGAKPGGRCLFPRPGKYLVETSYNGFTGHLSVEVVLAEGVDAKVHDLLIKDPEAIQWLLGTIIFGFPDKRVVALLEQIVTDYSDSSYADYARFALARLAVHYDHSGTRRGTPAEKAKARELLEKINFSKHPDGAAALVLLYNLSEGKQAAKIKARLDSEFFDAFEWLAEQAEKIPTEEWVAYDRGKRVVREPRSPKPVEPEKEGPEGPGFAASLPWIALTGSLSGLAVWLGVFWRRNR